MSIASEPNKCPKCGTPIPSEAPQGLCPKCLLQEISTPTEAGSGNAAKSSPPSREELIAAFPHLEIHELIGQGGMGFVFKARQPKLDRFVALKILPQSLAADPAFAERFSREGRLLARLNHPNIVTVHDFGQAKEYFYLLMEFVDGVNLREAMKAGRFTADQALAIVPKICEALQFAHNEGILHRDIKPENILLDTKGRVKIADFGIAKLVSEASVEGQSKSTYEATITQTGKTLGTPNYMAPEQIEKSGAVDHRADIYSLGVVFYEMLTGELPLGRFDLPSQKSATDPRLDDVVLRALEREPKRRTQSADAVKTQVESISGTKPVGLAPEEIKARPQASAAPDRFWRRFAIAVGIVLLALISIPVITTILAIALPSFQRAKDNSASQSTTPVKLFGTVVDEKTEKPIVGARVAERIAREYLSNKFLQETLTDSIGRFDLRTKFSEDHLLTVSAPGYETNLIEVRVGDFVRKGEKRFEIRLQQRGKASAETWAPTIAPGEKFEPKIVLEAAEKLMREGSYEEALQRHLWFHSNAQKFGDSYQSTVRLTSALSNWEELGRRYPKAKQAMVEIRDEKTREIIEGRGYTEIFQEVQAINRELQNEDATLGLFKKIIETDPKLAQQCYFYAERMLMTNGLYELYLDLLGDSQRHFESVKSSLTLQRDSQKRMAEMDERMAESNRQRGITNRWSPPSRAPMSKTAEDYFVGRVSVLIEILIGAGRREEAVKIRDQSLAVLDDARLKSAVEDAEERVEQSKALIRRVPSAAPLRSPATSNSPSINTNFVKPSASLEKWSPTLAGSEKPNLGKILQEAKELMAKTEYEEALQRHIWYHNHALEYDQGQGGVRLSFALSDWAELNRRYPKAKQALIEIRDRGVREIAEGRGYFDLFQDVASINRELGNEEATYTLFKLVNDRDPKLAQKCYRLVEELLVTKKEYLLCLNFIEDGQAKFESNRLEWERGRKWEEEMAQKGTSVGTFPKFYDNHFVQQSRRLIEILIGTGHKLDAEKISSQAIALLDDPRLKSALVDAEKRVQEKM